MGLPLTYITKHLSTRLLCAPLLPEEVNCPLDPRPTSRVITLARLDTYLNRYARVSV